MQLNKRLMARPDWADTDAETEAKWAQDRSKPRPFPDLSVIPVFKAGGFAGR